MKKYALLFTLFAVIKTFSQAPVVTSFNPSSGAVGSTVIVTGNNFSSIPANNYVFFGAVKAFVTAATSSQLNVVVPVSATYSPITVTTNGLTGYSNLPFVVTFSGGTNITPQNYSSKIDSTTDLHPNGVAAADFDGDGKPDLATPNNYSKIGYPASVSVLRNTGNKGYISFAPKMDIPTGTLTFAIAAGDLNGDGKPDLVSSSIVDKTISIFKNSSTIGSISFAPKLDYITDDNPFSISINDIDGDGKPDISVANYFSNTVSVFRNTSFGGVISFEARVNFATGFGPRCIAVGDLDGDGKPDLALSNEFSNSISTLRNTSTTGNISFGTKIDFASGSTPFSVAMGDLNNDGKLDIVIANKDGNNISILKNIGSFGTIKFETKIDYAFSATPLLISIDDVNGDGKPDIVVPAYGNSGINIFQNAGSGTTISFLYSVSIPLFPNAYGLSLADLDGDGKNDIAAGLFTSDKISLLRNKNIEPRISYFRPTTATNGATVIIVGENFSGVTAISFGGVPASSFTITDGGTRVNAVIGSGVSGAVKVTNQYGSDTLADFVFAGPPLINSFTPLSAGTNQVVNIFGDNLSGATEVSFGGILATSFTIVSPKNISAVLANGATGDISVTTPYGTGISAGFIFIPTPVISSFSPTVGIIGDSIKINGLNFTGTIAVNFGGIPASSFKILSPTSIAAVVGPGASGTISVTSNIGTGTKAGFTFIPPPIINSFSPLSGQTGTVISISGSNFTGVTEIRVGNILVNSFSVLSPSLIEIIIGSGGNGNISIKGSGGKGTIAGFIFIPPPVIYSISPYFGYSGSTITINGQGFSEGSRIKFGTVEAKIISKTPTTISVIVPTVSTNQTLNVTTRNLIAESGLNFKTTFPGNDTIFTQTSFENPVSPAILGGGEDVITADIDGDGLLDDIVADIYGKKVAIYRNISISGSILFDPKIELDCFWLPTNIIVKDIDGDGKPDLLVGNRSYSDVFSIFRNTSLTGKLSFDSRLDFPTVPTVSFMYVAAGDLDGDGRPEIVLKTTGADFISIYKNNSLPGQVLLGSRIPVDVGTRYTGKIIIADIDGDNKDDIIFDKPNLLCLKNTSTLGEISFLTPILLDITGELINSATTFADIDNDGKLDVAAIVGDTIRAYRNKSNVGDIAFEKSQIVYTYSGVSNLNIAIGDLDGDGKEELVTRNGSLFQIFKNQSSSGKIIFSPPVSYVSEKLSGPFSFGDIDGDSKMDILVTTGPLNIFRNLLGNSTSFICPGSTSVTSNISGSTYQWQQDAGSGFFDISNNAIFSGTKTGILQINSISTASYRYKFRCSVDNNFSIETIFKFRNTWTGVAGSSWENPLNWSCGITPDSNTDVVINSGSVIINANTKIRSLIIKPNVVFTVNPGVVFTVVY